MKLNMLSRTFSHVKGSTYYKEPKKVEWDFNSRSNHLSVYIDNDFKRGLKDDGKKKFLWLLESRKFGNHAQTNILEHIDSVLDSYEQIWTHNQELLKINNKFKWVPAMGSWIYDSGVHKKSKKVSMITSNKVITEQQSYRVNFAKNNKSKIDLYGQGFNPIKNKEEGLNEYMYSVAIENDTYDTYFTEKLLDCFMTGTIPVFKGSRKIVDFFDEKSIIFIDDEFDINSLTEDYYYENLSSIRKNYELSLQYDILDDWIYDNYLKEYE